MEEKDLKLWEIAQRRAAFRKHLFTYAVVIVFLWLVWLFTRIEYSIYGVWPIYPTLGWGIGLAFNYFNAYHWNRKKIVEQEYQKLLEEEKGKTGAVANHSFQSSHAAPPSQATQQQSAPPVPPAPQYTPPPQQTPPAASANS